MAALDSVLFRSQVQPDAARSLGLGGSLTPDELAERKKKLMAAGGGNDPMARFGSAAFALFGAKPTTGY